MMFRKRDSVDTRCFVDLLAVAVDEVEELVVHYIEVAPFQSSSVQPCAQIRSIVLLQLMIDVPLKSLRQLK